MKKIHIVLMSTLVLLFNGCATRENFVKKYNGLIGQNINTLINQIGYPNSSYDIPNGDKVYVYNRSSVTYIPSVGFGGVFGTRIGRHGYLSMPFGWPMWGGYGDEVVRECTIFIETDKKGTIVKWGSQGNSCVSN